MNEWADILLLVAVVAIGTFLAQVLFQKDHRYLRLMLVFSGAFLLGIAVLHVLPEVYAHAAENVGLFVLGGFLLQVLLDALSKGIEHGHFHVGKAGFPIAVFVGLFIHAYVEGMPLASHGHPDHSNETEHAEPHDHHGHHHDHQHEQASSGKTEVPKRDVSLLTGVLVHKLPIAFALTTLLISLGVGKPKQWLWALVFAAAAPLGILTTHLLVPADVLNYVLAVALGSFLHVSTTIILENDKTHRFNFPALIVVLSGFFLAWLVVDLSGHVH